MYHLNFKSTWFQWMVWMRTFFFYIWNQTFDTLHQGIISCTLCWLHGSFLNKSDTKYNDNENIFIGVLSSIGLGPRQHKTKMAEIFIGTNKYFDIDSSLKKYCFTFVSKCVFFFFRIVVQRLYMSFNLLL